MINLVSGYYTWRFVIFFLFCISLSNQAFKYVEFPYKDTKKNEIIFREFEIACQQGNVCSAKKGIENIRCARECISPSCYSIIYKNDELEDGEIDIRLSSFKGCFIQRSKHRAH